VARDMIFADLSLELGKRRALVFAEDEKRTAAFLNLMVGVRTPDRGRASLTGRPSWPIGQNSIVRGLLTGREVIRFLAATYNLDVDACVGDAERWFSKDLLATPTNLWASGERSRLERLC